MIDKGLIELTVTEALEGSDCFPVCVTISGTNEITVEIDSMTGVDIATCEMLSRKIESVLDRDVEDYELEVGSSGLTSPLKVKRQYDKNIGNEIEVLTKDGRKQSGILESVTDDGTKFTMMITEKVKEPGKKRPVMVSKPVEFNVADTKYVKYLINFK